MPRARKGPSGPRGSAKGQPKPKHPKHTSGSGPTPSMTTRRKGY